MKPTPLKAIFAVLLFGLTSSFTHAQSFCESLNIEGAKGKFLLKHHEENKHECNTTVAGAEGCSYMVTVRRESAENLMGTYSKKSHAVKRYKELKKKIDTCLPDLLAEERNRKGFTEKWWDGREIEYLLYYEEKNAKWIVMIEIALIDPQ